LTDCGPEVNRNDDREDDFPAEGVRMKSPFPGMDPYIEACGLWGDFHSSLISEIKRGLARVAPDRYLVRTQERSYLVLVEPEGKETHSFLPDVSVSTTQARKKPTRKQSGTAVLEPGEGVQPVSLRALVTESHQEAFVEIYETTPEQRLVTCIEVLSPSNKRPNTPGWDDYLRKRQSLLLENVHLVEIDLLRGGQRLPMFDPWPDYVYTLLLARAHKFQRCLVWPGHFRAPLPPIPIPLADPDPDLTLDLQPMIDSVYEVSRYGHSIDYTRPLSPRLGPEDAAWLKRQLRDRQEKGR
jgi:hypothetical protein